jgi:hypothetical protein
MLRRRRRAIIAGGRAQSGVAGALVMHDRAGCWRIAGSELHAGHNLIGGAQKCGASRSSNHQVRGKLIVERKLTWPISSKYPATAPSAPA